jgi:ComF family protein
MHALPTFRQKTARLLQKIAQSLPHICALCHQSSASSLCKNCLDRYFAKNPLKNEFCEMKCKAHGAQQPRHIIQIGEVASTAQRSNSLEKCVFQRFPNRQTRCRQCAHPLAEKNSLAPLCGRCLKQPPAFDRIMTITDYLPPADQLVQSLKFGATLALAPLFARLMEESIQNGAGDIPLPAILAPVPLSDDRLAIRGFNQALEIAKPLSRRLGIPLIPQLIRRIRETVPQTTIALLERKKNMHNAFAINEKKRAAIQGTHVGLVDDVLTTGETMGEIARILKKAGAQTVTGFVFARTPL